MAKKNYLLFIIGMFLGVLLTEFFNPGEIARITSEHYSGLFPFDQLMGALESTFQIRDPFNFQLPLPIPIISDFIIVLPEIPFIITWVIVGAFIGLLSRRVSFGTTGSALVPVILLIIQVGLLLWLQPTFWVVMDLVSQIQFGFRLVGPLVWAAIFAAIAGTIGGRITRPPKLAKLMVDMSEIEQVKVECPGCKNIIYSDAEFCAYCGTRLRPGEKEGKTSDQG